MLDFNCWGNCSKFKDGINFYFAYVKAKNHTLIDSLLSNTPDDFYNINLKPGQRKTLHGWIKFRDEGAYQHLLYNYEHSLFLKGNETTFFVQGNYIANQIKTNRNIESFSYITVGVSLVMLAFFCFQSFNNKDNRIKRNKGFTDVIAKLDEIQKTFENIQLKPKNKKKKKKK